MITLLDVNKFTSNLKPVGVTDIFSKSGEFHPRGLFSEEIFGAVGSNDRRKNFSYIDLHSYVIHPTAYDLIYRLDRKVEQFVSTEKLFSLDKKGKLFEDPNNGVTGLKAFMELFPKINFRGDTDVRLEYIKILQQYYKENILFINKIPILPPDFRPIYQDQRTQEWISDKLNEYYITILRRSFQVQSSSSGPLYDLLVYGLQKAVIEHDKFIKTKIVKKDGIIRQNMLGKRTDFSGRAVITPNATLNTSEIGIPFRMAVVLFEPFIIFQLLKSGNFDRSELDQAVLEYINQELNIGNLQRIFKNINNNDKIPDKIYYMIFKATKLAMENRVVLAKRDPVLHVQSYAAYKPIITEGNTIEICPVHTAPHNADFDGDQMAIFHPLTNEAQEEAKQKMMKVTSGTTSDSISIELGKEMWAGLYLITRNKFKNTTPIQFKIEDKEKYNDPYILTIYKNQKTTIGKALFNSCFPLDFPFINEQSSKKLIASLFQTVIKKYGETVFKDVIGKLYKLGFKWVTIMAPSISLEQLDLPKEILVIKEKLKKANIEETDKLIKQAEEILKRHLENTGFGDLVLSGSTKGWGQPLQILIAKGIIADPKGNLLDPIKGSFADGLSNKEFFNASYGARKGIIDRVLLTATTGYLSRKLAYYLNNVEVDPYIRDCKTDRTLDVKIEDANKDMLTGRFVLEKGELIEFSKDRFRVGDVIKLRTPIYCKSEKICHTCYGKLVERHKTPYVGILAAQIIGERGSQNIMRTFHTGGAVSITKRDMLADILSNDPLASLEK